MEKNKLLELVSEMSLEEKAMQMTQLVPDMLYHLAPANLTGPLRQWHFTHGQLRCAGSVLGKSGAAYLKKLQDDYLKDARLPIPLLFMADVIHGYETILPIPLAQGCTFDPELVEENAAAVAREAAAAGLHVTFSPMADLVRDPRWGRVMEACGEDPWLNGQMAAATVRGYQGNDPGKKGKIAACVKHFAAYGQPEGGRDYNTVDMSRGVLRDFYLPAYREAVRAGAAMVMTSFNTVERVPATCNRWLLDGILRKEWGFQGVVISDYTAAEELMNHSVAADVPEAGEKCIHAGLDIEMMSGIYAASLAELLEQGRISEQEIDMCVMRILELKNRLGLFENPWKDADEELEKRLCGCKEHLELARKLARESMVLLKNDNVLPLSTDTPIGLAGPFSNTGGIFGEWSYLGNREKTRTLQEALTEEYGTRLVTAMTDTFCRENSDSALETPPEPEEFPEKSKPADAEALSDRKILPCGESHSVEETRLRKPDVPDFVEEALNRFRHCGLCIVAAGEPEWETGEAASKTDLRLSPNQEKLIRALHNAGKKVVLLLFSGRPLDIAPILDAADAVLQVWFPGSAGADAVTDILTGKYNPSGRLSMSFPRNTGQIPVYYNCYNTGRPVLDPENRFTSHYLDCPNSPLFPFGYGLSYTTFSCRNLKVSEDHSTASVLVENTGNRSGETVVQLYLRDVSASVVRPLKELKGFRRIALEAGDAVEVSFRITADMLSFYNEAEQWDWEPGEFDIMIGLDSEHVECQRVWFQP